MATWQPEQFLRSFTTRNRELAAEYTRDFSEAISEENLIDTPFRPTVPGIGPGGWDAGKLAREQERKAVGSPSVTYRLYTEDFPNLNYLTSRYFDSATLLDASGSWKGELESSVVIEIVGTHADLQTIVHLAGDIRVVNNQTAVLITWNPTSSLLVTA